MRRRAPWRFGRRAGSLVLLAALGLLAAAAAAAADSDEPSRQEPGGGEIAPLTRLLQAIDEDFDGEVLRVELERWTRHGASVWVYEAKLLTPQGAVLKLDYDAATIRLLHIEGRPEPHRHEDD